VTEAVAAATRYSQNGERRFRAGARPADGWTATNWTSSCLGPTLEPPLHSLADSIGLAETYPALRPAAFVGSAHLPAQQVILTIDQCADEQHDILPIA
jgi:hypothetical protein